MAEVKDRLRRGSARWFGLAAIMLAAATVIVLAERLRNSQNAVMGLRQANASLAASVRRNRQVLEELCSTNSIISGLVSQTVVLFQHDLDSGSLPPKLIPIYRHTLETFEGYRVQLDFHTACNKVKNP